jgi:hypothetical protein
MTRLKTGLSLATTAIVMMAFSPIASSTVRPSSQSILTKSSIETPLSTVSPEQVQATQLILAQDLKSLSTDKQKVAGYMDFNCSKFGEGKSISGLELIHCLIYGKLQ